MSPPPSTETEQSKEYSPTFLQTIFSWRAMMALHMHLSVVLIFVLVQNLPYALVCMLKAPSLNDSSTEMMSGSNHTSSLEGSEKLPWNETRYVEQSGGGEFEWGSSTQGLLLSSSRMLAFLTPLAVDKLCRTLGGKRLMVGGIVTAALLSVLSPGATRLSPFLLMVLRIAIGCLSFLQFPLMTEIFSWWAPDSEKVTMLSFGTSGTNTGLVLASVTSGFLCSVPYDNGWPFIFYVHGAMAFIWCITWQLTGSVKPEDHPYISEDEKQYIIRTRRAMDTNQKRTSPPYRQILTSVPVWACVLGQGAHAYAVTVLSSYIPLYLNTGLGFSVEQVGLIASVSYVVRVFGVLLWGQFSNLLMRKTRLHTTACRKMVQCGGYFSFAAGLCVLGWVRHQVWAIVLLNVVLILQGCSSVAVMVIPLDIAPRYAGFLCGFILTLCVIISIPGPLLTSFLVQNGTAEEWRNVFLSVAVVAVVGTTCFLFMATSQLQSWALSESNSSSHQRTSGEGKTPHMSVTSEPSPSSPSYNLRRYKMSLTIPAPNVDEARLDSNGRPVPLSSFPPEHHVTSSMITEDSAMTISDNDETAANTTKGIATGGDRINMNNVSTSDTNKGCSQPSTLERSCGGGLPTLQRSSERDCQEGGGGVTNLGFDGR